MNVKTSDASLWAQVAEMARAGTDPVHAFRKIRVNGGRDLTKNEDEFNGIYARFTAEPLFARNMVLNLRRAEFKDAVKHAMFSIDVEHDNQVDAVIRVLERFDQGDPDAFLDCIERIRETSPAKATEFRSLVDELWPGPWAEKEAERAAKRTPQPSAQLELPFGSEPERNQDLADVPA
jgi:hypothetical protein